MITIEMIRLALFVFISIALISSPIEPMIKGGFPQNTFSGQVCLLKIEDEQLEENFKKGFLVRFSQVVQIIYTLRFLRQVNKFVGGQCPAGKMCSIGKYRRNVFGLKETFWAALLGSFFPILDYFVRFLSRTLSKRRAFYVNFIVLDSLVHLFYVSILLFSQKQDIPSIEETPRRVVFYVSKPARLEPRRWCSANDISPNPIVDQDNNMMQKIDRCEIPTIRKVLTFPSQTTDRNVITMYCSSNSCRGETDRPSKEPKASKLEFVKEEPIKTRFEREDLDEIVLLRCCSS